jgi:hypothetical protein
MNICQNCGKKWTEEQLEEITHGFWERVSPGEVCPSGECPECGALCTPEDSSATKELLDVISSLVFDMLESHEEELQSFHHGDSAESGADPVGCSVRQATGCRIRSVLDR